SSRARPCGSSSSGRWTFPATTTLTGAGEVAVGSGGPALRVEIQSQAAVVGLPVGSGVRVGPHPLTPCPWQAEVARTALGERHTDYAASQISLAMHYRLTGRHAEAESLARQDLPGDHAPEEPQSLVPHLVRMARSLFQGA